MAAITTPAVAATAHQRWATKVPMRMRNSPTKPLSPGTPIEASMARVKTPASTGAGDCRPFSEPICHVLRRS